MRARPRHRHAWGNEAIATPSALRHLGAIAVAASLLVAAAPAYLPLDVHAADEQAVDGRLVILWKHTPRAEVHGLHALSVSRAGRRSVVVAPKGRVAETAAKLRLDARVAAVVPDQPVRADDWPADADPNDTYYAQYQADFALIGMPEAWRTTTGSSDVTVAVLDTGVLAGHPDFVNTWFVDPRNEIANTASPVDGYGHGTHVTGTIAASTNNGVGVAGMAPGVRIMPVKVLSDTGSGYFSDVMDGIDWARTHGADVITMSLGALMSPTDAAVYQPTIDAAYAAGITIDASSGNTSSYGPNHYPSAFNHVISVAATDNAGTRASFSTFGETVDVAAPGVSIASTYLSNWYANLSGTSMSAPHVAATAALVRSAHPGYTVDEVEQAILDTATDEGVSGRDDYYGAGLINVAAAIRWAPGDAPAPPAPPMPVVPPSATGLRLGVATVNYDATRAWCPTAVTETAVTATTAVPTSAIPPATKVVLHYTRLDGSEGRLALSRGTPTATGVPWTGKLSTVTDRSLVGTGVVGTWVVAESESGGTSRYPAGSGTVALTVRSCANPGPRATPYARATTLYVNPVGSGVIPAGGLTSTEIGALATDTDGVASAKAVVSGAGLTAPVTVPLALANGARSATLDPGALGIVAPGTLAWSVVAADGAGGVSTTPATPITIARANTPAVIGTPTVTLSAANVPTVRITVVDPDAAFGPATSTGSASISWSATWTDVFGLNRSTTAVTAKMAYAGNGAFTSVLSAPWLTTGTRNVRFRITPTSTDAYKGSTTAGPSVVAAVAGGAPTIAAVTLTPATTGLYTNPLGSGTIPAGGTDRLLVTATVADTDAVNGVVALVSGPGLATPAVLALEQAEGTPTWSGTLDVSRSGIKGTGTVSVVVRATDVTGLAASAGARTVRVTRADTPAQAAVAGATVTATGITVTATAEDDDATFAATTNLGLSIAWSATYTNAFTGTVVTTRPASVPARFVSGHTYTVAIPRPSWFTTGTTGVVLHLAPVATDPYGAVVTGPTKDEPLTPIGAPTVGTVGASVARAVTNPLGTGVVPAGLTDKVTFSAAVADTDDLAKVEVVLTGAGLAAARTVPLEATTGLGYAAVVDLSAVGVTASGTLSWAIAATDAAGLRTLTAARTIGVTRADTPGQVAVTGTGYDAAGNVVVTLAGSDADSTLGATTATATAALTWSATIGATTFAARTTAAVYKGNGTWQVVLPVATALNAARSGSFTFRPTLTDAYRAVTTGSTTTTTIAARS